MFPCPDSSKFCGEAGKVGGSSELVHCFPACVVLFLVCLLSLFCVNSKVQMCNTNTWFSHFIVAHLADS